MKRVAVIILLIIYALFSPVKIFAHVLESNGSVGAVLHITPEDDPIAGEQSGFFFEFKDKENKFNPKDCDCNIYILQNGKEIYSSNLFQGNTDPSLDNASLFYTFPKKDVYKIKIIGSPISKDKFQKFTLEYDIRVSRINTTQTDPKEIENKPIALYILIGVGLFIIGVFLFKKFKDNKSHHILVIILLGAFLFTTLIPLELTPHSHNGTEPPIHNNFSFIPKDIHESKIISFYLILTNHLNNSIYLPEANIILTSFSIQNKSPPIS